MRFASPLILGILRRRYKRFFADVQLANGQTVVAHCANTGAMTGLAGDGRPVLLSQSTNPRRQLAFTWEMSQDGNAWVSVNTGLANRLVFEALQQKIIPELAIYAKIRREVPCGAQTRLDFLLENGDGAPCFLEVKSVTLRAEDAACFPDAVTLRGRRHLEALAAVVAQGQRGFILFLTLRDDCQSFRPAEDIDPTYAKTLRRAVANGVEILSWHCRVNPEEIIVHAPLPMELSCS